VCAGQFGEVGIQRAQKVETRITERPRETVPILRKGRQHTHASTTHIVLLTALAFLLIDCSTLHLTLVLFSLVLKRMHIRTTTTLHTCRWMLRMGAFVGHVCMYRLHAHHMTQALGHLKWSLLLVGQLHVDTLREEEA
jgi:hypothetical protein